MLCSEEQRVFTNDNIDNTLLNNNENKIQISEKFNIRDKTFEEIWNYINSLPDNKSVIEFITSFNDYELKRINDLQVFVFINTPLQDILN